MNSSFADKVVLITGSSQGIGKTLAVELGKRGAKVVLNGRNKEKLQKTAEALTENGMDVFAVSGDVSKAEDCQQLIEKAIAHYGRLDVLINNAGISTEGKVSEITPAVFRKIMDVNYLGSVFQTQAALPELKKTKGSVIFVSSVAGIRGLPNYSVYSSSKMALTALAEALRIELAPDGVHVGIAYVGFTENDPNKTIYNSQGELVAQPKRDFIKPASPTTVANLIISMIEKRTFKKVFTPLGKLNAALNRLTPGIVHWVLKRNFYKTN